MIILNKNDKVNEPTIITVGNFDGVHIAHIYLLNFLKQKANELNLKTFIYTFSNHPEHFFGNNNFRLLTTSEEKIDVFSELGVDFLFLNSFDEKIANLQAEEFVRYLVEQYNMKAIVLGDDNSFGKQKKGNAQLIEQFTKKYNYEIFKINSFIFDNKRISSSMIREHIINGSIEKANELLGHQYFIISVVIEGKGIGKTLGFPTANLKISGEKLIPLEGVYAVVGLIDNNYYLGICNIGSCPTFKTDDDISVEIHFLDFYQNIYSKKIKVLFLKRIRSEVKFSSKTELTQQIKKDEFFVRKNFSVLLKN